ncbi:MAG: HNH endonuclease [Candidatus Aminicenantes bacterium]|nr:HNH endonuclease [Candidatus Aminicenantes bacterium]
MTFPHDIREKALVASGRRCCLCHKFCGTKIECHHIIEIADGGLDTFDNCIPLCFDCHSDMGSYDPKHPKGTKYSPSELKKHRDLWYEKIAKGGGVIELPEHRKVDTIIFKEFRVQIPWDLIVWLKEFDFASSFLRKEIEPLRRYLYYYDDPKKEFLDAEMETARGEFLVALRSFMLAIGKWTFPTQKDGFNSVPPDWELKSPDSFKKAISEIHDAADTVVKHYLALIQLGRRRLGVP